MEQMTVSNLCIYVMLYSETCLQRSSKGPIFFSVADRFRFIQVLEVWVPWTVNVSR